VALAAGGILAMLADTMFPEALQHGGPFVALATAVGFASLMGATSGRGGEQR
jgi:ZIP family zinc transporter